MWQTISCVAAAYIQGGSLEVASINLQRSRCCKGNQYLKLLAKCQRSSLELLPASREKAEKSTQSWCGFIINKPNRCQKLLCTGFCDRAFQFLIVLAVLRAGLAQQRVRPLPCDGFVLDSIADFCLLKHCVLIAATWLLPPWGLLGPYEDWCSGILKFAFC